MFKGKNIRSRIFNSYAILFTVLFVIVLVGINYYMKNIQEKNAFDNLNSMAYAISGQLDSKNESMYNFAVNVSSSNSLLTSFFSEDMDEISLKRTQNAITNLVLSIAGPMYPLHRIVLRRGDGMMYEYSSREINLMMEDDGGDGVQNYRRALGKEGTPFFSSTFTDPDAEFLEDVPVVSVCLSFPEMYGNNYANTVEVQETYDTYKKIIKNIINADTSGVKYMVYVYDSEGQAVYPYTEDVKLQENAENFWEQITGGGSYYRGINNGKKMGSAFVSSLSGWTTLVMCDYSCIKVPYYRFLVSSMLIVVLFLLIVLYISYKISASITIPLRKIIKSISEYRFDNKENLGGIEAGNLDEITALGNTFDEMSGRIEKYIAEVTALKVQDWKNRYYALQSQMNPHFLYNSLSILSIMCEEGRTKESVEFCEELARMLRYSSQHSFHSVSLKEEMDYAEAYLKLLQKRYEMLLDIDVVLPASLEKRQLPKMIVQPLVENAVKYGLDTEPPWFISVEASELEGGWRVMVSDTGNGFSDTVLEEIREQIRKVGEQEDIPNLKIGGMGLINIYVRLRLLFHDNLYFEIGNLEEGGAFVQIDVIEECDNEKNSDECSCC